MNFLLLVFTSFFRIILILTLCLFKTGNCVFSFYFYLLKNILKSTLKQRTFFLPSFHMTRTRGVSSFLVVVYEDVFRELLDSSELSLCDSKVSEVLYGEIVAATDLSCLKRQMSSSYLGKSIGWHPLWQQRCSCISCNITQNQQGSRLSFSGAAVEVSPPFLEETSCFLWGKAYQLECASCLSLPQQVFSPEETATHCLLSLLSFHWCGSLKLFTMSEPHTLLKKSSTKNKLTGRVFGQ